MVFFFNNDFWDDTTKIQCKIYFAEQFDKLRRNCGIDQLFEQSLSVIFYLIRGA